MKYTNVLVIMAAVSSLLLMTGCSQNTAKPPVAKVQKSFKQSIQLSDLKEAISLSANENGWKVVNDANGIELRKIYTTSVRKPGARPWIKTPKHYDVTLQVSLNNNSLNLAPSQESVSKLAQYDQIETLNKELSHLEKAIYMNLVEKIL